MERLSPEDMARALGEVPLFREIQRALSTQAGPVNIEIARQIASAIARAGPEESSRAGEEGPFQEAVRLAELRISEATGFDEGTALTRAEVMDRQGWAALNLEAFRPLLDRLAARLSGQMGAGAGPLGVTGFVSSLGPLLFGVQVGFLVGQLAHQLLGQYDLCLPRHDAGRAVFIVPNILRLEREFSLDPRQLRLYLSLHEVTHMREFDSVSWTRSHFNGLIEKYIDSSQLDSTEVMERLEGMSEPDRLGRLMEHPEELIPLMLTSEQRDVLEEIHAFMSVLEGFAEWAIEQAGRPVLDEFDKIREAITRLRAERTGAHRLFEALLGVDLAREKYRAGERFVRAVAGAGKLDLLWRGPESLPAPPDLEDPTEWLARIGFA